MCNSRRMSTTRGVPSLQDAFKSERDRFHIITMTEQHNATERSRGLTRDSYALHKTTFPITLT